MSSYFVTSRIIDPTGNKVIGFERDAYENLRELVKRRENHFKGKSKKSKTASKLEITARALYAELRRDNDGIVYFPLMPIVARVDGNKRNAKAVEQRVKLQISAIVSALGSDDYTAGRPYEKFRVFYWESRRTKYGYLKPTRTI